MSLDCWGRLRSVELYTERPRSAIRFEPRTFLLWGDSANRCNILPPPSWLQKSRIQFNMVLPVNLKNKKRKKSNGWTRYSISDCIPLVTPSQLPVLQVTFRRPTCGPSRSCPSWRSPWSSCRMWRMAPCMKAWPMGLTPPALCSSTCSWCSATLPSATSTTRGFSNTLPSSTGLSCLVTVTSTAVCLLC